MATANAEIRRGKNFLRGELPKLRKMMDKKMKGLTDEEKDERVSQVDNFEYQIECVPDGVNKAPPAPPKPRAGGGRIRAGSGLPGAHFFSSPWLRRMISAELAILAGSGSDSARCLLCPSPATRVRSFHSGSGQEHGRVLNNLKVRVIPHGRSRAYTRGSWDLASDPDADSHR